MALQPLASYRLVHLVEPSVHVLGATAAKCKEVRLDDGDGHLINTETLHIVVYIW